MSKILISGYYGFANAGDEAMLTAIIKSLRSYEEQVDLTVISGNPEATAKRHQVSSIHRFNPLEVLRGLWSCDLLLSGGGSLLQDVTSRRSLLYYLSILGLGQLLGKRVMLFAQGIGPITSPWLRRLTSYICSRADLITVRDQDSLYELRRLGLPEERIALTADAVFTLPKEGLEAGKRILAAFALPQQMKIAISVRHWPGGDRYLLELAKAADKLVAEKKAHILLLPLQYPADVASCRRLQQLMAAKEQSTVLDIDCNTEEFLSIIGNVDLLIGMRLHALIFAAVMEVPFVAISYDPKIDGFVKDIRGIAGGKISSLEAHEVLQAAEQALTRPGGCQSQLAQLRDQSMLNAQKAFQLLKK